MVAVSVIVPRPTCKFFTLCRCKYKNLLRFMMAHALLIMVSSGKKEGKMMQLLSRCFSTLLIACSLAGILGSLGCNTIRGMGQDIERAGEKTQEAADAVKRRL